MDREPEERRELISRVLELPEELRELIREQGDIPPRVMGSFLRGADESAGYLTRKEQESFTDLLLARRDARNYAETREAEDWSGGRQSTSINRWMKRNESQMGRLTDLLDHALISLSRLPPRAVSAYQLYSALIIYSTLVRDGEIAPSPDHVAGFLRAAARLPLGVLSNEIVEALSFPLFEIIWPEIQQSRHNYFSEFLRRFPRHRQPNIVALLSSSLNGAEYKTVWPMGKVLLSPWREFGLSRDRWALMSRRDREAIMRLKGRTSHQRWLLEEARVASENLEYQQNFQRDKKIMLTSLFEAALPLLSEVDTGSVVARTLLNTLLEPVLGTHSESGVAVPGNYQVSRDSDLCKFVREVAYHWRVSSGVTGICGVGDDDLEGGNEDEASLPSSAEESYEDPSLPEDSSDEEEIVFDEWFRDPSLSEDED